MLTQTDYAVIAAYAALMAWIGILAKRKSGNVEQYFAAGHGLPWWMAAISHHVSGYSAVAFVGFCGPCGGHGVQHVDPVFAWRVRGAGNRMPRLGAEMVQIESSHASGISGSALRQFRERSDCDFRYSHQVYRPRHQVVCDLNCGPTWLPAGKCCLLSLFRV